MNMILNGVLASVLGGSLVAAGADLGAIPASARHAVNQQVAAAVTSTAQIRSLLPQTQTADGFERHHSGLAASEAGIVAAMSLYMIDYQVNVAEGYVSFRPPTAPADSCEVRYYQASQSSPWRVELSSSPQGCGIEQSG